MHREVHGVARALEERRRLAGFGNVEHADAIELRTLVILWREVCVALDDEQAALGIEVARNRMHDIGAAATSSTTRAPDRQPWGAAPFCAAADAVNSMTTISDHAR